MTNPQSTRLDLGAITKKGWAGRGDFPDEEYAQAAAFYAARRAQDPRLHRVREKAAALIKEWTGRTPRDVGSFGIRLNLESSDLDLGIGYPVAERQTLLEALAGHAKLLGERKTRFSTSRLVFAFEVEGVEVDLSALTEEDFAVACRMLDEIEATMTLEERVCHTWVKHLLREAGRMEDYADWKLVTYRRFCSEFNWVPIPEKTGS
ncbi:MULTISPECIES: hypothetical protein [Streptomyces]|uniref:Nucleotidyltransferase domain-containing protein n=1 Tax=Streptomyces luteosporeus TaxID=173856 RepID=A0ABN3TWT5_9ACTN